MLRRAPLGLALVSAWVGGQVARSDVACAQQIIRHDIGGAARAFHTSQSAILTSHPPSAEAVAAVKRIMDSVGLKPNFSIRSSTDVFNAEAIVENGGRDRYVLYNPDWLASLSKQIDTSWAETSILAHEIGHHLQFHMDPRIGNVTAELEADRWSGFVLARLGAPIEAAQLAMAFVSSDAGSVSHPPKADRLKAIAEGWRSAATSGAAPAIAALTPPREPPPTGDPAPLDAVMTSCVTDPRHPAGRSIAGRLAGILSSGDFAYGWPEETTLANDAPGPIARDVRHRIAKAQEQGGELTLAYDWQNGHLRLVAVAPPEIATRGLRPAPSASFDEGEDRKRGARFQGVWVQDNSYGCIELHFGSDGQAAGMWAIPGGRLDTRAFIARESRSGAPPSAPAN